LPAIDIVRASLSRKFSDEVEVFSMSDVVVEKQKMAERGDAYFNGELIEERQKEIEEIEVLMVNLHGIVKDLAQVVENQDEKFIQIGQNARKAHENTKKAKQEVIIANENRGLANNKM
jgi:t-SNARE complex subunit (syntaxin)